MAFRVNWTERALADLTDIVAYIAAERPGASERVGAEIIRKAESLVEFSRLGSVYRLTGDAEYRSVVSGNYRIIYYFKSEDVVDIVTIRHSARDLPELP
jgi:toxin ParE1/3/4